ncbi:MAG TPA: hypothetical protein EYG17_09005 [Acidimicrobiia bacterium]|jgi:hypothetical protein|nr:hypothetical protein [Acidimicrobiia bacterium]
MKLRDYRTLLSSDKNTAMLFDLTERHPRGPYGALRNKHYEPHDSYYGNAGAVLALLEGVESASGSTATGGWDPYEVYELPDSEWNAQSFLQGLEVPLGAGMGDSYHCDDGKQRLFKRGAQLTRRAKRFAYRVRKAKEWVKENIGTAVYQVQLGGYGSTNAVYVHADNEEGAKKQWELFMETAFTEHCDEYRADRVHITYTRPAKTPLELMSLNAPLQKSYRESVATKRATIERLQKEIEAMDMAEQVVNIYAINMVATWGTGEGDSSDAN